MIKEFPLPDLGEGLTESEIVAWRVAVGDHVELNQIIADVDVPINACGIAVGALLGVANAECEESGAIAD